MVRASSNLQNVFLLFGEISIPNQDHTTCTSEVQETKRRFWLENGESRKREKGRFETKEGGDVSWFVQSDPLPRSSQGSKVRKVTAEKKKRKRLWKFNECACKTNLLVWGKDRLCDYFTRSRSFSFLRFVLLLVVVVIILLFILAWFPSFTHRSSSASLCVTAARNFEGVM